MTRYNKHLKDCHKVSTEEYAKYFPSAQTAQQYDRPQLKDIDLTSPLPRRFDVNQTCTHQDCSGTEVTFYRPAVYAEHLSKLHGIGKDDAPLWHAGIPIIPFYPTECLHPDCADKRRLWTVRKGYSQHLQNTHSIKGDDADEYQL